MRIAVLSTFFAAAFLVGAPASAQSAASAPTGAASAVPPDFEPQAVDALRHMGRYLQTLDAFTVRARTSTDQIFVNDQKIQFDSAMTMFVRRPDRVRIDMTSDRRSRQFFYDGKSVVIYGKNTGYYAKVPAPPTLRELASRITDDYGLELPLADLFAWGDDTTPVAHLTGALAIGLATVRGAACDQYAFRQEGLDWQIWIQRGPHPLPLRLVLTTTSDPVRPQHSVDLEWSLTERPSSSMFAFVPPAGAHEIPMQRADGTVPARP